MSDNNIQQNKNNSSEEQPNSLDPNEFEMETERKQSETGSESKSINQITEPIVNKEYERKEQRMHSLYRKDSSASVPPYIENENESSLPERKDSQFSLMPTSESLNDSFVRLSEEHETENLGTENSFFNDRYSFKSIASGTPIFRSNKDDFKDVDGRPPIYNGSEEHYSGSVFNVFDYNIKYPQSHSSQPDFSLPWYPWPKENQRVKLPFESMRTTDENGLEDPFDHHPCGCWWYSYVCCGADHRTFINKKEYDEEVAGIYGWELPPIGTQATWTPETTEEVTLPPELSHHFNIQTMVSRLRTHKLLSLVRKYPLFYILVLSIISTLLPSAFASLIFAAVPMGNPFNCRFRDYAVFALFTNPITEVVIAFSMLTFGFGCIDPAMPWRPMSMYLPLIAFIYIMQILVVLPIVLTVGPFAMMGIITRFTTYASVLGGLLLLRRAILTFDVETTRYPYYSSLSNLSLIVKDTEIAKSKKIDQKMSDRFTAYCKYLILQVVAIFIYFGYAYLQKVGSGDVQTALSVVSFLFTSIIRKVAQSFTITFQKDFNYLASGFWVYTLNVLFNIFSTPNYDLDPDDLNEQSTPTVFVALALGTVTDLLTAFSHQSHLWFRFRCWVKVLAIPVLTNTRMWVSGLPIHVDMNFDGRGSTNAHPEYRRSKVQFDMYKFMSTIAGNAIFLVVGSALRNGMNRDRFPFTEIPELSFNFQDNEGYLSEDFIVAVYFALAVMGIGLAGMSLWIFYIWKFYPQSYLCLRDSLSVYHREPYKIGFMISIITSNLFQVIGFFLIFNRIWYADTGSTFICR